MNKQKLASATSAAPKISRRSVLAGGVIALAAPALARNRSLRVGVPNAYPFARMRGARAEGIIADPVKYAFSQSKYSLEFVQMQLDNIYRSVENGSLDGGLVMTPVGGRGARATYLDPVVQEYSVLLVRRDYEVPIQSIEDLSKVRLGGRLGFFYRSLPLDLAESIKRNATDAETIRDLLIDNIDVAIVGGIKVMHELQAEGVMLYLRETGLAVGQVGLGAAMSNIVGATVDRNRLNAALTSYLNSSRWPLLLQQHASSTLVRTPRLL
ncbi:MAG: transporter substrate-binding domain-containing protein [Pseudomonadota bacterium]